MLLVRMRCCKKWSAVGTTLCEYPYRPILAWNSVMCTCVHVYACFVALRARSYVVYRPVRFSCSDICTIVHPACDMWGAQSHTSVFCPKRDKMRPAKRSPRDAGHFPPKRDCPAQSGTVGHSKLVGSTTLPCSLAIR